MFDFSFKCITEVSFCTWDDISVIYNVGSGNTYSIEHVPIEILNYCFSSGSLKLDRKQSLFDLVLSLNNEWDSDYLGELLNRFIKMDLLEKIG